MSLKYLCNISIKYTWRASNTYMRYMNYKIHKVFARYTNNICIYKMYIFHLCYTHYNMQYTYMIHTYAL